MLYVNFLFDVVKSAYFALNSSNSLRRSSRPELSSNALAQISDMHSSLRLMLFNTGLVNILEPSFFK